MAETPQAPPRRCGILTTIATFLALLILIQWMGTELLGLNVGGTLIAAILLSGIGVHIVCTLRTEHSSRSSEEPAKDRTP